MKRQYTRETTEVIVVHGAVTLGGIGLCIAGLKCCRTRSWELRSSGVTPAKVREHRSMVASQIGTDPRANWLR